LLLSHRQDDRLMITGLVILRCAHATLPGETALIAGELSRMFAARGDLIARALG
jgi:hypothetical protein